MPHCCQRLSRATMWRRCGGVSVEGTGSGDPGRLPVARRLDCEDGALGAEQDFLCGAAEHQLADWAAMAKADDDEIRTLVGSCLQDVVGRAVSSNVVMDAKGDAVVCQSTISILQPPLPPEDVRRFLVASADECTKPAFRRAVAPRPPPIEGGASFRSSTTPTMIVDAMPLLLLLLLLLTRHSTLDTRHSTLDTRHSTLKRPDTRHSTLDTRHSTLDTRHSTLDTRHSTLDTRSLSILAPRAGARVISGQAVHPVVGM